MKTKTLVPFPRSGCAKIQIDGRNASFECTKTFAGAVPRSKTDLGR